MVYTWCNVTALKTLFSEVKAFSSPVQLMLRPQSHIVIVKPWWIFTASANKLDIVGAWVDRTSVHTKMVRGNLYRPNNVDSHQKQEIHWAMTGSSKTSQAIESIVLWSMWKYISFLIYSYPFHLRIHARETIRAFFKSTYVHNNTI